MDGQEYLNQISNNTRPVAKSGKGGFFHSKFFMVGAIGLVGLILIIILGSMIGGAKTSEKDRLISLKLHIEATAEIVNEYQANLKSSSLRSSSASLYGVLTNTDKAIANYLSGRSEFKEKEISKKVKSEAEAAKEKLKNELFEAKINGLLDRTMAHKMAYEISILMTEEATILKSTKNENLKSLLEESRGSLDNIYNMFNDFSEGK